MNDAVAGNGDGTKMWEIPTKLSKPCFYADTSDDVIYQGGNRGGYWGEKGAIRDAESGKNTTVVDIASENSPKRRAQSTSPAPSMTTTPTTS